MPDLAAFAVELYLQPLSGPVLLAGIERERSLTHFDDLAQDLWKEPDEVVDENRERRGDWRGARRRPRRCALLRLSPHQAFDDEDQQRGRQKPPENPHRRQQGRRGLDAAGRIMGFTIPFVMRPGKDEGSD